VVFSLGLLDGDQSTSDTKIGRHGVLKKSRFNRFLTFGFYPGASIITKISLVFLRYRQIVLLSQGRHCRIISPSSVVKIW